MDSKSARNKVMQFSLKDTYELIKDGMETAEKNHGFTAAVRFAQWLNDLDDIVDMFAEIEKEEHIADGEQT